MTQFEVLFYMPRVTIKNTFAKETRYCNLSHKSIKIRFMDAAKKDPMYRPIVSGCPEIAPEPHDPQPRILLLNYTPFGIKILAHLVSNVLLKIKRN